MQAQKAYTTGAGESETVSDAYIAEQRRNLAINTKGQGFGPQSPRNIDIKQGKNRVYFGTAPDSSRMNLCNIHFHKNAEHAGGEFTTYAGNGDGHGYQTGYKYDGHLSKRELTPSVEVCPSDHGGLKPGDTIEVHYVHSSAKVVPGASLGACLSDSISNPDFRVEAQVFVLVNDENAVDFTHHTQVSKRKGFYQAPRIPRWTGEPVVYAGSTTGPGYNEDGSPYQVTWSVRPKVVKVDINTVGSWCEDNQFDEDHAHGVRNLVKNPHLLSKIK
ncbi:delta-class carbonic anhydrase [Halioxenophilus aromaticivorans]|uniref:delta-class carbonic anhydrase n=1 Tax=Halioxenophilus aromaticivorans TaxID=1306992 RepID=UPI0031EC5385